MLVYAIPTLLALTPFILSPPYIAYNCFNFHFQWIGVRGLGLFVQLWACKRWLRIENNFLNACHLSRASYCSDEIIKWMDLHFNCCAFTCRATMLLIFQNFCLFFFLSSFYYENLLEVFNSSSMLPSTILVLFVVCMYICL